MINNDLRKKIVDIVVSSKEGHIPSSFSIVDIIEYLYSSVLNINPNNIKSNERDFFILSKGHGAAALFVVLEKFGFISKNDLREYGTIEGILGGHPDCTKVPGVEASTGSLGHGFPFATGIALGLKIKAQKNKVYCLLGDGECHEGTIWESANIAANNKLNNLCAIIDWNGSAQQLMPIDDLKAKWLAFGWSVDLIDGHNITLLKEFFAKNYTDTKPRCLISKNIKGKGVSFLEGHGSWHHKVPNSNEYKLIMSELNEKN